MLSHTKKNAVRNTLVGQSINNSSIRKIGEAVKKPIFIKK